LIALLSGCIFEKHPQRVIVDVNGVGYDVQVPLSTFYNLGDPGAAVTLRVHTHVREDAIALFGFATPLELELFERLIGINGVGPKLALAVLSGIEPAELVRAIRLQDVARLTTIPGVGKKTAERIALELKDRLPKGLQVDVARPRSPEDELQDDVISALLNLGYQRSAAEKAIERAAEGGASGSFQDVLKRALRALAR
jgi:Holliday junction DNA helicase RuvA